MASENVTLIMISKEELSALVDSQRTILLKLDELSKSKKGPPDSPYVTAQSFMAAVSIRRWKFNALVATNKIKVLKKKRKIYVLASEISRYFSDPAIP